MLDNLEVQNMTRHFVGENNKAMSIYCNMSMIKDKYSSFQTLHLFPTFKILSVFAQDLITPQEIEDTHIRHFRRKTHSYKPLIILGIVLLTQQLQGSWWCKQW